MNSKVFPELNSVQSGPIPKPEEPVFGNVPDQGPAVNDDDDDDDEFGYNEYEATWPAGLMSQHDPAAGTSGRRLLAIKQCPPLQYAIGHAQQVCPPSQMAIETCSLKPESEDGWVLDLDYDGDEGAGLPYYYARVKPASEEVTEMSIDSPSTAPVPSAPSHPPTGRFPDFIVKESLRKLKLKSHTRAAYGRAGVPGDLHNKDQEQNNRAARG
ncbi:hypothetical protein CNMCM6805_000442 [Aspergillus fumigatiaffinis]|uniref:Uncharacterized protein n=1 Tax=Aspergillus fumigatiaffinis TaxID=340414 RepID=A0A8H4HES3_9EURO|nr:hypothetical protein CNMCM6457_005392 [Aspergillus fumigatiaffinis]KAF4243719.1 hypothetical protein CNMCM6805_000442 [Aspergillus fumigatiaffinis]